MTEAIPAPTSPERIEASGDDLVSVLEVYYPWDEVPMHRRVNSDGIDPFDEAHMFVGVQEHADIQESDISLRHLVLAKNRLAYWAGRFVEEFQFFEPGEDGNPTYRFTLQRHHSRKNGFTKSIISSGSGDSKAHLQSVSDQMGITDLTQELNAAN